MRENIRGSDYLARWGGKEFVIVCPNMDEASASARADAMRAAIAIHNFSGIDSNETRSVTISAGVASL